MTCVVKDWKHAVGEKKAFYKLFAAECNKLRAYSKREFNFPDPAKINQLTRFVTVAIICPCKTGFFGERSTGVPIFNYRNHSPMIKKLPHFPGGFWISFGSDMRDD